MASCATSAALISHRTRRLSRSIVSMRSRAARSARSFGGAFDRSSLHPTVRGERQQRVRRGRNDSGDGGLGASPGNTAGGTIAVSGEICVCGVVCCVLGAVVGGGGGVVVVVVSGGAVVVVVIVVVVVSGVGAVVV